MPLPRVSVPGRVAGRERSICVDVMYWRWGPSRLDELQDYLNGVIEGAPRHTSDIRNLLLALAGAIVHGSSPGKN